MGIRENRPEIDAFLAKAKELLEYECQLEFEPRDNLKVSHLVMA